MLKRVLSYISEYNMLEYGDRVIVGVSGGADSVCLLNMLCEIKQELNLRIEVVHINHCIRGKAADEDEEFVKNMANELGCKVYIRRYEVEKAAAEGGLTVEEAGRELRYAAFYEIAGSDKIAVAHNMNDNCETMLMRFFRGTGLKGLGGIAPVRGNIIRPILCLKREEIEAYCKEKKLPFRTDATNLVSDYTRNRIRLEIIPQLEEYFNASIPETMYRTSALMRSEEKYIDEQAKKAYDDCIVKDLSNKVNQKIISIDKLQNYPPVIGRRVIRLGFESFSTDLHDISYSMVESVISLCKKENGKTVELVKSLRASRQFDNLYLYRAQESGFCYRLELNKPVLIKEIGLMALLTEEKNKKIEKFGKISYTIRLKCDILNDVLLIRSYKSGDKIYQKGLNGHKLVKKIFGEHKIDERERQRIPLLVCGQETAVVCGLRLSERFQASENELGLSFYLYEDETERK